MIVKDEEGRALDTLESFAPFVDRWVVVDTGSTDETCGVVRDFFSQEPNDGSELLHAPFVDFSQARNEALRLADSGPGWLLMLDCDMRASGNSYVFRQSLQDLLPEVLAASLPCSLGGTDFARRCLVRAGQGLAGPGTPEGWHFVGAVHEVLVGPGACPLLPDLTLSYDIQDHARRADRWLKRDLPLLMKAVRENPKDGRALFYLGQTWHCLADSEVSVPHNPYHEALKAYQARVKLGPLMSFHSGYDEELFHAQYRIGECLLGLDPESPGILEAYLSAWALAPNRAEPIDKLSRVFLGRGHLVAAWHFGQAAAALPLPKEETLFVDRTLYQGGAQAHLEMLEDMLRRMK
jgi:glycosyltransferase involved in cell wall biosynthesis